MEVRFPLRALLSCSTFLVLFVLTSCGEPILHELSERQANEIYLRIAAAGIKPSKLRDGAAWKIEVARSDVSSALAVLANHQSRFLLQEKKQRTKGFLGSRSERKQQVLRELEARLTHSLVLLPGVVEARVHLSLGRERKSILRFAGEIQSAAILIHLAHEQDLQSTILELVSGATELSRDRIKIISFTAPPRVEKKIHFFKNTTEQATFFQKEALLIALFLLLSLFLYLLRKRGRGAQRAALQSQLLAS